MYEKNHRLAEKMWQKLQPIFKNSNDLRIKFDAKGNILVSGDQYTAEEIFDLIDEAEASEDMKWDMRTIHYLDMLIRAHGGIKSEFVTSDEPDEMKDYSAYYVFSVAKSVG